MKRKKIVLIASILTFGLAPAALACEDCGQTGVVIDNGSELSGFFFALMRFFGG